MAARTHTGLQDRWLTGQFVVATPEVGVALVLHEPAKGRVGSVAGEQMMQWRRGLLAQAVAAREAARAESLAQKEPTDGPAGSPGPRRAAQVGPSRISRTSLNS